mmetsp:Transcript_9744/g.24241  ORF Transcript_9744/g.24241 Transcript_9744/m.24241 type:complete len:213 (+) Transcript_9744:190-828(+)
MSLCQGLQQQQPHAPRRLLLAAPHSSLVNVEACLTRNPDAPSLLTACDPMVSLHVNDLGQLLDAVEQQVALLQALRVQRAARVGPAGLDDARHLVNLGVQPAAHDELRHLCVHKLGCDVKRGGHGGQGHTLVGLQELRVRAHAHFAHKVARVCGQVRVALHQGDDLCKCLEKVLVPALVQRCQELGQVRHLVDNCQHLRGVHHLGLECDAVQ